MRNKRNKVSYLILLSIGLFISFASAQDVKFIGQAPQAVENGQQFQISYTVTASDEASDFKLPEITDFEYLGGGQNGYNSININGNLTVSITYSFYFRALKEGSFNIAPATVKVKRKLYESNSITIEVVKGTSKPNVSNTPKTQGEIGDVEDKNLFLKIFVDKKNIYLGEAIVATVKLFNRYNFDENEAPELPSYSGFFKQEIETKSQFINENINGTIYQTALIQRVLLFPSQTGELTIDPASLKLVVLEAAGSSFGFRNYRRVQKNIKSNQVTINVKPLPAGKPLSFTGAVGEFTMDGTVNKTIAETSDALTFKVTLKGKGNIKLSEPPQLKLPPDFELYEPKVNQNITNTIAGQSGTKTFEYLAIPRHPGKYTIDPIEFTYFDLSSKSYKTLKTPQFDLLISKGKDTLTTPVLTGLSKEEIKFLGSDIMFIKTKSKLNKTGVIFFRSLSFYLLYPALLIIMLLIIIVRRKRIEKNKNVWLVKNKKANKKAKLRLKQAHKCLKENKKENFYEEISKALWGYLSDKLSISLAELTKDNAKETLQSLKIKDETIGLLIGTIDECEYARYAPQSGSETLKDIYERSVKLISTLEQNLR